jgi:hypothetical protein
MKLGRVQQDILADLANGASSPWRNYWPLASVRRLIDQGLVATNSGWPLQSSKMVVHITDAGRAALNIQHREGET